MFKIFFLVLVINILAFSKVLNASSSLKIIDGDTIILNSEKIRLYGIDTCLLYTSDAADDIPRVDLGGRRIIKKIF